MRHWNLTTLAMDQGSRNYDEYLWSDHWREFRRTVLRKYPQCRICREMANVVHHLTYDRIGGELLSDVVALCEECHNKLHDVHRKHKIPFMRFDQAAKHVRRSGKVKPAKSSRKTSRPTLSPVPSSVLPVHRHDLAHLARKTRKYLADGRSLDWMARRFRCDKTELAAMVVSIRAHG